MRSLVSLSLVGVSAFAGAASSGCLLAAAGAGGASGIYLTTRGVESLVDGTLSEVAGRTQSAFVDLGIRPTGEEIDHSADAREFRGVKDDLDITVRLEREAAKTTRVEVTARRNVVEWDKDYARDVLGRIVAK